MVIDGRDSLLEMVRLEDIRIMSGLNAKGVNGLGKADVEVHQRSSLPVLIRERCKSLYAKEYNLG